MWGNTWDRTTDTSPPSAKTMSIWSSWYPTAMVAGWNVPPASHSASNRYTGADAMTNQFQSVRGRVMRHASRYFLMGLLIVGATWASAAIAATTTLKNISYDALPGGSVQLHLNFGDGPVPEPKIFTTDNPPRIAVDLPDTTNAAGRHMDIGKGSTSGVSAVSAGGRTRVVVELMRASSYRASVDGNSLVLTINNGTADQAVTTASTIDPTKRLPSSSDGPAISNIDFRRGPNGEGRVLVSFSGSGAQPEMTRQGDKVVVTIDHANLPANLAQRLDTLDFATPCRRSPAAAATAAARATGSTPRGRSGPRANRPPTRTGAGWPRRRAAPKD